MFRKFKGSKYNRLITTGVLILLQFIWIGVLNLVLTSNFKIINILTKFLAAIYVLYILQKDDNPSVKLGWIILILVIPIFGVPMYFLYGDRKPTRKMYERVKGAQLVTPQQISQQSAVIDSLEAIDERGAGTCKYIYRNGGFPVYRDTAAAYYPSGETMFHDMYLAIKSAEMYVFLEYFIIEHGKMWDSILKLLVEKAEEGVAVRLIYDDFGVITKKLPRDYDKQLEALHPNIKCLRFNPVRPLAIMSMNNRDHRKMLIVDGEIAFTGGINLADEYINEVNLFGHWKDTGVRLRGEAVNSFVLTFAEMWNAFRADKLNPEDYIRPAEAGDGQLSDGYIQPFSDCPLDEEYLARNVMIDMLGRAREYVWITTPYLIIDNELRAALIIAAKRGIDVRIVTPGTPDKRITFRLTRANFRPLLKAGAKIFQYTPGFIHSKSVVVDGVSALVGTVNLDYRSMYLHFECGVYMYGSSCIEDLNQDFHSLFRQSQQVTQSDLKQGLFGSAFDSLLRAFETLF